MPTVLLIKKEEFDLLGIEQDLPKTQFEISQIVGIDKLLGTLE